MFRRALIVLTAVALAAQLVSLAASADSAVVLSTNFPAVVADKGKQLTFPVNLTNRTNDFQQVDVRVADGPADWTPDLRASGFSVRTVMLEPQKAQAIEFSATPPASAKASDYAFVLRAFSGSAVVSELRIAVTLRDTLSSGLKLSTQFPALRGRQGSTFSFKFDLVNQAGIDRDIGLSATAPQGWQITFKPSFDTKQVSSFRVKAGETQGVDVDVSTPQKVPSGDYDVVIVATASSDKAESPLKITIVGESSLSFTTTDGRLNAKATVDQDTKISFVLKNTGGAPLQGITFSSSPPESWTVKFQPERVDALGPGQQQDVTATVRPGSRALAGDYMVSLTASATGTSSSQDIRITVDTPTGWGVVAILAIVAVLGGLGYVFTRYSRR